MTILSLKSNFSFLATSAASQSMKTTLFVCCLFVAHASHASEPEAAVERQLQDALGLKIEILKRPDVSKSVSAKPPHNNATPQFPPDLTVTDGVVDGE